jgi:hypothetical protein
VYNFGATLYWVLTGKYVPTLFNVKKSGVENAFLTDELIKSPTELNPQTPEPLSNMVMECVRINPLKRPGDMTDVSRRLDVICFAAERDARGRGTNHTHGAAAPAHPHGVRPRLAAV